MAPLVRGRAGDAAPAVLRRRERPGAFRDAPVRLTVLSDTAAVLLVRGYDVRVQLTVGQPAQVEFLAARTGDFDVVVEPSGLVLTTLQVS